MGISESLLPEFDHEMANTRKTLERVPHEKFAWKPHEKSTAMGGLATHLSNLPTWAVYAIDQTRWTLHPRASRCRPPSCRSRKRSFWLYSMRIPQKQEPRLPEPVTKPYLEH